MASPAQQSIKKSGNPTPQDFDHFFPWACTQMGADVTILVIKSQRSQYQSISGKDSKAKSRVRTTPQTESGSDDNAVSDDSFPIFATLICETSPVVYVQTLYDELTQLVQIKFLKNDKIPRMIINILGLVIPYHKALSSIVINNGVNAEVMYELSKFLPTSHITEMCLDNTFVPEGNYHILLDSEVLKHLSIAKCGINDEVVKTIAAKLAAPYPASKSLCALNLSSNKITDTGVKYLAEMLRTNRRLCYLNLADNVITDDGASSIFDILVEFVLTAEETFERNKRLMTYLKTKTKLIQKVLIDLQSAENLDKKGNTRKKLVRQKKDPSFTIVKSCLNIMESHFMTRAENIVDAILGPLNDPFGLENTVIRDDELYCFGNNTLAYLNIAYNNISYISLKKLYEVLITQSNFDRKPKGLINLRLEGEYVSVPSTKSRAKKTKKDSPVKSTSMASSDHYHGLSLGYIVDDIVIIHTVYDQSMNLVQIKFLKNMSIPREIMKLIAHIIPLYRHLTSLTVNSGLSMETIYEISKILNVSKITEVCLDGTNVIEANYHILLDNSSLKHLSLARCNLNDIVVKLIAERLVHPYKVARTLSVLNLASNYISDLGAKHLAKALRTNRHLAFLNISANQITDKGAGYILDILTEFPLTKKESMEKKIRHLRYLKEKMDLYLTTIQEIRLLDDERKQATKRKASVKAGSLTVKRRPGKEISHGVGKSSMMFKNVNAALINERIMNEKAEAIVDQIMGPFMDPFDGKNTVVRDGKVCCVGNYALCYLNISFNNLSYASVKKLRDVVVAQKLLNRKPRGLVNVRIEGEYVSVPSTKSRAKKTKKDSPVKSTSMASSDHYHGLSLGYIVDDIVIIHTVYDQSMNLVQIKFLKNMSIPREIMKLIAHIIPLYRHLTSLTVNSGLSMETIYEISKILNVSKITEVCLDGTNVIEANYHILLDNSSLKHLSLARCNLNDIVVKLIAERLVHPYKVARTLSVLNLASNYISDLGAKHLAKALRTNRHLAFLNISANQITDKGAGYILDILTEFPLTKKESMEKKIRHLRYLKEKMDLYLTTIQEIRLLDDERKQATKRKASVKAGSLTVKRRPGKEISHGVGKSSMMFKNVNAALINERIMNEKAEAIVDQIMGPFMDPFDGKNTVVRDGKVCCVGNYALCYLNISFNNLSYASVKKLRDVVVAQKLLNRKPRGLVNVRIEGNYLPSRCSELLDIDEILGANLSTLRKPSNSKKKTARSASSKSISH
uniref:Uncharacterized protein n=1 Tax=Heliothis virescens TaxID=7102 RepID=A0A2A4JUS3_HELVI